MSDQTSRFVGTFSGIHFGVKQKKGEPVQTAGLNFDVELDETSIAQVTGIIGLQKQQVHLSVSRRQPGLFDEKPQGKLLLGDGPAPAAPALPEGTWQTRIITGEDGLEREILIRTCGERFLCVDCGVNFILDPGDALQDELRKHDCSAPADEILLDKSELTQMEATLKVPCKDGVTREFNYELTCWRAKHGPAVICGECDDIIEIPEREAEEKLLPIERMAAHACPPVCHKCHAEMKFGAVFAERLRFHHPECPQAKLHDPDVAVATALDVQGADPYATRVENALDAYAREFLLEDATEAFARIEEEVGLTRHVGREGRNKYKAAHFLSKKDRKEILASAKKASKGAWNRISVLLQDIDAAKAVCTEIAKKEQQEQGRRSQAKWNREKAERDQEERDRIEQVLAGEPQSFDELLREVLYRETATQKNWIVACERGADYTRVKMMISTAFGPQGGDLNVAGETSISWKSGYTPKFWVGPAAGVPTLEGDKLVDAVRRIMRIPAPPPEPEQESEGEGNDERACRSCDCTEFEPCLEGCSWVETDLCSNPDCLEGEGYTPEQIAKVAAGELPSKAAS